jgi:Domain of unknown function (DUF222)
LSDHRSIDGSEHRAEIDAAIAEALSRQGSWSKSRMRAMVDAIIFRRDPDLVRKAREEALNNRGVWAAAAEHGMANIDAYMAAEDIGMIMSRLEKLALSTCKADPRSRSDRMADALFATAIGREFCCQCPNDPKHSCTADIVTLPADQVISGVDVKIVMHVIADQATVEGRKNNPGFLDGASAALDSYIRIRDRYCSWPGCNQKAWGADLDHTCEYNHDDPAAGGCTHHSEMKTLCRFHHLPQRVPTGWMTSNQTSHWKAATDLHTPGRLSFSGVRVDRRRPVPGVEADRLRQPTRLTPSTRGVTAITEHVPHGCQTRTPPARTTDQPEATRTTATSPPRARRGTRKE